jgi:structural maintenance of chromosome 1
MLWQVFRIKSGMEEHQQLRRQLLDELSRINDQDGDLENEIANCKSNLARLNKNVVSVDKDYTHKEKSLSKITPKVTVAKDQIKSFDKRVTELVKVESKIQADYVAQSESIKGLKSDLEKLLRAEESLKLQFEASTASGLHLDKAKLDEYSTLRLEVSAQTSRERSEQVLIENELSSKRQRIQELEFQESYAKQEIESIDSQLVDSRNRLEKISGEIGTFNSELANLVSSRDSINDLSVKCEQERNKLLRESEEVTARLQDAGDARQRSKQEDKMNSAIEAMQRIFPGVKGKLADLCKPVQKKYAQAISVAAGKHMDAIVVDSKQVAADCIRYLKDQRIGTCSFLPLDNISPKPVQERLRGLGSSYRLCCDLIESDDRYRPAVMYAVGSSIVCDTLEEAQDLCFRRNESVKVVTLNGHVISKSGSMTGGSTSREKHDRWEIKEIENLRHSKVELDEKLAENKRITPNRQTIVDIEIRLKTIQGKIDYTVAEKEMLDQKIQQLTHQRDMSTKHMRDLRKDIVKLQKDMDTKTRQLSAIIEQVRSVEATVFSAFSASMGVENIREFEETQLQQHNELVANMAVIGEQRASLLAQVEYENKRDFSGALQRQKAQISEVRQNIELKQKELLALTQEENKLRSQIAESAAKKASAHNERKEAENLVKSLQAQKSNINAEKDAVTKKVTGEEIQIEKLRGQLHELLQRAQVEEIALPTVETGNQEEAVSALDGDAELQWTGSRIMSMSLDSTGGERRRVSQRTSTNSNRDSGVGSSTQHSLHFSQSENSLMQQEEGRLALVDLSSIRREASKMDVKRQLEKQQQLAQDIELLTEELTKIQPNMHAAERYEGVIEKLRDCSDNLDSVQQVAKSVSTRFEEVRELRQQLFMECYNHGMYLPLLLMYNPNNFCFRSVHSSYCYL